MSSAAQPSIAFLNNAGSSPSSPNTLEAVIRHLRREAEIGGYLAFDEAAPALAQCHADVAALIGGSAHEVALTHSDTASWNKAWWGWVLGGNTPTGSLVLTDRMTYHSHYATLLQTQAFAGFEVRVVEARPDGTIAPDAVAEILGSPDGARVRTVIGTYIAMHCGSVAPIGEVGAIARSAGVPLFVDGCQAIGQREIDVRALGISLFTGTGRKWLRAPRGTGMLWVDESLLGRFQPPGMDALTSTPDRGWGIAASVPMGRFEEFELSIAALVGMGVAASEALAFGMAHIQREISTRADDLRTALRSHSRVVVRDLGEERCGIVSFTVEGVAAADVVRASAERGATINSIGTNWAALDLTARGVEQVVRVSPHIFNTTADWERVVDAVASLI